MRLTDPRLEAAFVAEAPPESNFLSVVVDSIDRAQGVRLLCPCGRGHRIPIGFANPRGGLPTSGRCTLVDGNTHQPIFWQMSGSGLDDLTLSPSVDVWKFKHDGEKLVRDGSCWHGHIQGGAIT